MSDDPTARSTARADSDGFDAWRLSGAGNDFLALVEPKETPDEETIRAWCRRGTSLGADGVFRLRRATNPVVVPGEALGRHGLEVEMVHWNADGGRAELCVNGTRCAARLAFHLGWTQEVVTLLTDSGPVVAHDAGPNDIAVELPAPAIAKSRSLHAEGRSWSGHHLVVGGPHFVLPWDTDADGPLHEAPVNRLGAALRRHPDLGAAGANVHFVVHDGADRVTVRSFERGVEAETLACGSGVLAVAAVGQSTGKLELPATARTRGGFSLRVRAGAEANPDAWTLTADARLLARLAILPGASQTPSAPQPRGS